MSKRVAVIGAGFAGLSAACRLAQLGFETHVFEKHSTPGGRCRVFEKEGFTFDMGPSWYWMPEIFDQFFEQYGEKRSDYYTLERIDPSYRVYFSNKILDIPASADELGEKLEAIEPGSKENLKKFLAEAKYKYDTGMGEFVWKPSLSAKEFLDLKLLKAAVRIHLFNSISSHIRKYFKHPEIIQLLEFPVLFLGAKPDKTPALYSLMNYADIELGTWYPQKGMGEIPKAMEKVAKKLGVTFHYNNTVTQIESLHGKAKRLITSSGNFEIDAIIAGADYHHVETKMLEPNDRSHSDDYWNSRTMSPSSLLFYLGVNKRVKNLLHHNLFFDEPFDQHAKEIYDNPQWPTQPLFYACVPSITDKTVAPENCENIFLLVPVAPDLTSNEPLREKYLQNMLDRLEKRTGEPIRENIIYKRSFAHEEFISEYNSFKGNAYGLANTLKQTAILKPSMRSKKLSNLFYAGQLTVPGPGMPPSIISGQLAAETMNKLLFQS